MIQIYEIKDILKMDKPEIIETIIDDFSKASVIELTIERKEELTQKIKVGSDSYPEIRKTSNE